MRLDKLLANHGIGSRAEVKKLIKSGAVRIQGKIVKDASFSIAEEMMNEENSITVLGKEIVYKKHRYYMLHKPAGVVSATEDREMQTVLELFPFSAAEKRKLFPVGRLDVDTEGLLLVTDDGELAHRLLSPKKHIDKCYFSLVQGIVTEEDVRKFAEGLELSFQALPAKLEILSIDEKKKQSKVYVTIQEGKYHQVKRMFEAVGKKVLYLKRLSMGSLTLDENLAPGEFRELTEEELEALVTVHTYV